MNPFTRNKNVGEEGEFDMGEEGEHDLMDGFEIDSETKRKIQDGTITKEELAALNVNISEFLQKTTFTKHPTLKIEASFHFFCHHY